MKACRPDKNLYRRRRVVERLIELESIFDGVFCNGSPEEAVVDVEADEEDAWKRRMGG